MSHESKPEYIHRNITYPDSKPEYIHRNLTYPHSKPEHIHRNLTYPHTTLSKPVWQEKSWSGNKFTSTIYAHANCLFNSYTFYRKGNGHVEFCSKRNIIEKKNFFFVIENCTYFVLVKSITWYRRMCVHVSAKVNFFPVTPAVRMTVYNIHVSESLSVWIFLFVSKHVSGQLNTP